MPPVPSAEPVAAGDRTQTGAGGATDGAPREVEHDLANLDLPARLLALADDAEGGPLLERMRLVAGAAQVIDEFFQLQGEALRAPVAVASPWVRAVRQRVQCLLDRQQRLFRRLGAALADAGVELSHWDWVSQAERDQLSVAFRERLLPLLAPLATAPGQSLPAPANLCLNLAVVLADPDGATLLGTVELPPLVSRLMALPGDRFVPTEQVVRAHVPELFPELRTDSVSLYRVTRQGVAMSSPGQGNLLTALERQLRAERSGDPVRLEVEPEIPAGVLGRLLSELDLTPVDVYPIRGLLGVADVRQLLEIGRPELKASPVVPVVPHRLGSSGRQTPDLFRALAEGDLLVHPPYDSFARSVEAFMEQAAADPAVAAIKQTLYRPVPDDPVVRALARAAERGTHVVVLIELALRLSEKGSVACARALERAGAHVVYGLVGMRTHCPVSLVVRPDGRGVSAYTVLSTAAHEPVRQPELISLLSADPSLAADITDLFNSLTGYSRPAEFRKLIAGPGAFRPLVLDLVRREAAAGTGGRITLKVNRLTDLQVIEALYEASQAGVQVDLVVAGACALRPGVGGLSETIRVVAPIGRRPEGSRIFAFGAGAERVWYLTSGDLTTGHLDQQVGVAVPVESPALQARLEATLQILLADPPWALRPDGAWERGVAGAEDALRRLAVDGPRRPAGR